MKAPANRDKIEEYTELLSRLAIGARNERRFYIAFLGLLVLAGATLFVIPNVVQVLNNETIKGLTTLGGGFLGVLTVYPGREFFRLKRKSDVFEFILRQLKRYAKRTPTTDDEELSALFGRIDKNIIDVSLEK
jgi:hypothetical protein